MVHCFNQLAYSLRGCKYCNLIHVLSTMYFFKLMQFTKIIAKLLQGCADWIYNDFVSNTKMHLFNFNIKTKFNLNRSCLNKVENVYWTAELQARITWYTEYELIRNWLYVLIMSCQGTPCSKQARNLKFKWLQLDSNPQPLSL